MGRWKFLLHESENLGRRGNLLSLGRLLHKIRREPSFELREARILRRDCEQFFDQLQRFVEPAGFRERLDGPLEHRETVNGSRVEGHRRDMAGEDDMSLPPPGRRQYRGISGSTFSAHSSMPPTRFFTLRKPSSRRKFVMRPDRTPVLQYTTISSAVFSSLTRPGTCATGIKTARSRWAISHSMGSRTSRRTTSWRWSSRSFSASTVIWSSCPTCSEGPR